MDAHSLAPHAHFHNRPKRIALQIDPSVRVPSREEFSPISAVSTGSPITPINGPHSSASEGDDDSSKPRSKPSREKRKRSRVTPEQLVHLERIFATERSPTALRRKEISQSLGMLDRQTQIWFQNRRAKAKVLEGKTRPKGNHTPPESPAGGRPHAALHDVIHEEDVATIVPCIDLAIGSWRRISNAPQELLAYTSDRRRCLSWFIYSGGTGFKMNIAFDTITNIELSNATNGTALASLTLSQPPIFLMETMTTPQADGSFSRDWKLCNDWTEGLQATNTLRHDVVAPYAQLSQLMCSIRPFIRAELELRSSSYDRPSMDIPAPPMAGLTSPYPYDTAHHGLRRLSSTPISIPHAPHTAPPNPFPRSSFSSFSVPAAVVPTFGYERYGGHVHHHSTPISLGLQARSAQPMHQPTFYNEESAAHYQPQLDRRYSDGDTQLQEQQTYNTSAYDNSTPLLTSPFYPTTGQ